MGRNGGTKGWGSHHRRSRISALSLSCIAAAILLLHQRAASGEGWDLASSLFGLAAGTAAPTAPLAAVADPVALAEPQLLSPEVAEQVMVERRARLRARYDRWVADRQPQTYEEATTELPTAAAVGFPPAPDAPDGEITLHKEALAAELIP